MDESPLDLEQFSGYLHSIGRDIKMVAMCTECGETIATGMEITQEQADNCRTHRIMKEADDNDPGCCAKKNKRQ